MRRHISSRARIELRSGDRVGVGTVSTTVKRSFNGKARSSSQVKVLARHQAGPLVVAFTMSWRRQRRRRAEEGDAAFCEAFCEEIGLLPCNLF